MDRTPENQSVEHYYIVQVVAYTAVCHYECGIVYCKNRPYQIYHLQLHRHVSTDCDDYLGRYAGQCFPQPYGGR